jgi:hypothetical protein
VTGGGVLSGNVGLRNVVVIRRVGVDLGHEDGIGRFLNRRKPGIWRDARGAAFVNAEPTVFSIHEKGSIRIRRGGVGAVGSGGSRAGEKGVGAGQGRIWICGVVGIRKRGDFDRNRNHVIPGIRIFGNGADGRADVPFFRDEIRVIFRIHPQPEPPLLHVIQASGVLSLGFGFGECGEQHGSQNGNDGNDYEKFNQGKSLPKFGRCKSNRLQERHTVYDLVSRGWYNSTSAEMLQNTGQKGKNSCVTGY